MNQKSELLKSDLPKDESYVDYNLSCSTHKSLKSRNSAFDASVSKGCRTVEKRRPFSSSKKYSDGKQSSVIKGRLKLRHKEFSIIEEKNEEQAEGSHTYGTRELACQEDMGTHQRANERNDMEYEELIECKENTSGPSSAKVSPFDMQSDKVRRTDGKQDDSSVSFDLNSCQLDEQKPVIQQEILGKSVENPEDNKYNVMLSTEGTVLNQIHCQEGIL